MVSWSAAKHGLAGLLLSTPGRRKKADAGDGFEDSYKKYSKDKGLKNAQENQNNDFSVAKSKIYLNSCSTFELVCFLKTNLRKFINLDCGRTPEDQGYLKSVSQGPFWGKFGRP